MQYFPCCPRAAHLSSNYVYNFHLLSPICSFPFKSQILKCASLCLRGLKNALVLMESEFRNFLTIFLFLKDKPDLITADENAFDVFSNLGSRVPSRLSTSAVCTSSGYHANSPSPSLISRSRAHTPKAVTPITFARLNSPTLKSNGQMTRAVSPHSGLFEYECTLLSFLPIWGIPPYICFLLSYSQQSPPIL